LDPRVGGTDSREGRQGGDAWIARSERKIAEKIEKQAMEIVGREYADFGPTLASEYLERDHQITASRETVRQWMLRAGIWKKRKQRLEEVHVWRTRRSCFGELVQWDTSDHDWLEGRGGRLYLISAVQIRSEPIVGLLERLDIIHRTAQWQKEVGGQILAHRESCYPN
jgi:hypothetical protein